MNRILSIAAAVVLTSASVFADTWEIDRAHSSVSFQVTHMVISKVRGQFTDFSGKFSFDGKDFAAASVEVTIDPKSISTNNDYRDKDLRGPSFFNVDSLPEMKFKSTKITSKGDNKFEMTGDLTMHGVVKPVTLQGEFHGTIATKNGAKAGFSAAGRINRQEWGLKWRNALPTGELIVSDDVDLIIEVEADKKP